MRTITAIGAVSLAAAALAQPDYRYETLAAATRPTATASAPGVDSLFFCEQPGNIRSIQLSNPGATTLALYLNQIRYGGECGALGIALHPQYKTNGYIYICYNHQSDWRISRYTVLGDPASATTIDATTEVVIITDPLPCSIHNGGWIGFGPDGYLYATMGERGTSSNAQNLANLRGKLLRIDVDADDFPADINRNYAIPPNNPFINTAEARPEIWAYGLRNPWRCSFDAATGDLWIADVGAGYREEVNFQPASGFTGMPGDPEYLGGRNYGWPCMEGTRTGFSTACDPADPTLVPPILEYRHTAESTTLPWDLPTGCAITGGFVYRGCEHPELREHYIFGDYCSGRLIVARQTGGAITAAAAIDTASIDGPTQRLRSIERLTDGGILILGESALLRFAPASITDCNTNGIEDSCDIASDAERDANRDGIPDTCQCPADWDSSGGIDGDDIPAFFTDWQAGQADIDASGGTDGDDITFFFERWQSGC